MTRINRPSRTDLARITTATVVLWSVVGLVVGQTLPKFEDVPEGHIAQDAIEWAAANAITNGVGNNKFGMGQTFTRYEMVTFLCRTFDSANCGGGIKGSDKFTDVPEDHWANYSVGWAVNRSITTGVSATEFNGSQTLTREQMITLLFRTMGSPTGGKKGSDIFQDVPDGPHQWANLPIGWAFEQGITGGVAAGVFGFGTSLSREEMVLFLCRTAAPEVCPPSSVPIAAAGSQQPSVADCEFTDHVARVSQAVYQVHTEDGIGTAFYIGSDEWLTAAHVVGRQSTVTLRRGNVSLTARVIGTDITADLALLEAKGGTLRGLGFGLLSEIGPGHQLFSVGYPVYVASEPSVTSGVLSRIEFDSDLGTVVVTDTAVSPGNSGGPLLNKCGAVIGLVVEKVVREDVEGISYAVSESTVQQHLPVLRSGGSQGGGQGTPPPSGGVGNWTHFTAENLDGTMVGYYLTAEDHSGYSWEVPPQLIIRCGVSNTANDALFFVTDWLIQSDVGDDGDVIVEYRLTSMANPIGEWWWSDEDFESAVWAYSDSELVTHLRSAGAESLWVRVWDGFSGESNSMRFEIEGVTGVLGNLDCWR